MCGLCMTGELSSDTSSDEEHEEHNVDNFSLEVVVRGWSSWLVYIFLEDWEFAREASRCHLGVGLFLSQEIQAVW